MASIRLHIIIITIISLSLGKVQSQTENVQSYQQPAPILTDTIKLIDSVYTYFWRTIIGYWVNEDLDLYYYDHNTDLIKRNRKHWDESYGYLWYDDYRVLYTLEKRVTVEELKQKFDLPAQEWINYTLFTYTYDDHGNKTGWKWQKWLEDQNDWSNFRLNQYVYDDADHMIESVSMIWDYNSSTWILFQRIETFYDNAGQDTLVLTTSWNSTDSTWVNLSRKTSWYDIPGNKVREMMQFWNIDKEQWVNASNNLSQYDGNNLLLQTLYQHWDAVLNAWEDKSRTEYQYNELGLINYSISSLWNSSDSTWLNTSRNIYEYDPGGDVVTYILQQWSDNQEWQNKSQLRYVYKKVLSIQKPLPYSGITCSWTHYSSENQCLCCEGLKDGQIYLFTLYTMQGAQISSRLFNGDQPVCLRGELLTGIYLITITNRGLLVHRDKIFIP